ncbi:MAG: 2-succinyl-5-enolpyruvyl-6-hydroxy-3-cyclohexene-1-carboxylic-acid synthase [Solirubrobacteraceae bacterium]
MTATDTYLLLEAFCDELARCGLQHACTSPGSRSTPIVLSLVREPRITAWSHIDERCAGFFALGAAKASGRPTAVTCTSGTAAANLAPAVIEAFHARVPLLVLTADRPPELREVGAGQAIDQLKLYGDAVKWFFEVGTFAAGVKQLRWIRQLACRAYWTAAEGRPGPVHLNFPLHEPLVLEGPLPPSPVSGRAGGRPWVSRGPVVARDDDRPRTLPPRGIIVAGRDERGGDLGVTVAGLSQRTGLPLLADPLSGARHAATAIARYDLLLRSEPLTSRLRPDLVIRVGDLPTSKPLRAWLASLTDVEQLLLDPESAWQDPDAAVSEIDLGDPRALLASLVPSPSPDPQWLQDWLAADDAATRAIDQALGSELSEPRVAAVLGEALDPSVTLVVASSMPIRDVEGYFPARVALPRTLANRGANGIDGTVSTALGVAAVSDRPVVLLIGDVALLHDLGGLLGARRLGLDLTIVVIDNDGGGIFHFLAVSGQRDAFEEHVATPHGISFEQVAGLYGLEFQSAESVEQLRSAMATVGGAPGARLIEVRTDRERNLALHRRVERDVLAALSRPEPAASPAA